ncbi:MAG: hypothetical protein H6553_01685 [Chitinophagales bacterium]|nr:hypothetical protein [Chitinophagales bacterium]
MQKKRILQLSIDFIMLVLSFIVAYLLVGKYQPIMSFSFFSFLMMLTGIAVFFGKLAIHSKSSWLMNTVWTTRLLFFASLLLVFYLMIQHFFYLDVLEDYTIKSLKKPAVHLVENIAYSDIYKLKSLIIIIYKIAIVAVIIVLIKSVLKFFRDLKLND